MTSLLLTVGLPLTFILHNIEEYFTFEHSAVSPLKFIGNEFCDRDVFLYAVTILTVGIVAFMTLNYFYINQFFRLMAIVVLFSLLINGIEHFIGSLFYRRVLPGAVSAVGLMIPFSIYGIVAERAEIFATTKGALTYLLVSVVIMFVSIFISFWVGFFIKKQMKA
jgi:hypothetical protein